MKNYDKKKEDIIKERVRFRKKINVQEKISAVLKAVPYYTCGNRKPD